MGARLLYNRAEACIVQVDGTVVVYSKRVNLVPVPGDLVKLAHPPRVDGPLFDKFSGVLTVQAVEYLTFVDLPYEVQKDAIALLRGMAPQPQVPYVKHTLQ